MATKADIEYAEHFRALNSLLNRCERSEQAALLLSTCRNSYLTINALFAELQVLMGDAREASPLRSGCELMIQRADPVRIKDRFARAVLPVREFEKKQTVWRERRSIEADIQRAKQALADYDLLAAARIDRVLTKTNALYLTGGGWSRDVLALDLHDRPHLDRFHDALVRIFAILAGCTELGYHAAKVLELNSAPSDSVQTQLDLQTGVDDEQITQASELVLDLARALANHCDWEVAQTDGSLVVRISPGYERPSNAGQSSDVRLPVVPTPSAICEAAPELGAMIREALYLAHFMMCKEFEPNVARAPMPEPFVVSLPAPAPTSDKGVASPLKIDRIRCSIEAPADAARIAIAHLTVPEEKLNLRSYRVADDVAEIVARDVRRAIQAAEAAQCRGIIFPEYSVPRLMLGELMELSERHRLVIVAGLEGDWVQGQLCDEAAVAIPGERRLHFQRKQEPSLEEEAGSAFLRDGELRLFMNSPIGDFSVVVCSDFLQMSTLQMWAAPAPSPELVVVTARNRYHELYTSFAIADAARLYAAVLIANVCDGPNGATCVGSCMVLPKRHSQVDHGVTATVAGEFIQAISIHDVPLRAIRARSRGKPEGGFLAVPANARRS
jgi:predicted amidohydrolase